MPVTFDPILGQVRQKDVATRSSGDAAKFLNERGEFVAAREYNRRLVSADASLADKDWAICTANCTLTLPAAAAGAYIRVSTTGEADGVAVVPASGDAVDGDSGGMTVDVANGTVELYGQSGGWKVADVSGVTVRGALPVGAIFAYASSLPPEGAQILNGQTISDCQSLYPDFWSWLNAEVTAGRVRAVADADYTAELTAKGNCGAFVVNTGGVAGSVRLPSITTGFIQGASADTGETEGPGLPDITGSLSATYATFRDINPGALSYQTGGPSNTAPSFPSNAATQDVSFKASDSDAIYGASATVQPPAVHYSWCIQMYTVTVAAAKGVYPGDTVMPLASVSGIVPQSGIIYTHTLASGDAVSFGTPTAGRVPTFELWLTQPATAVTFTLQSVIGWDDGTGSFAAANAAPDMTTASTLYALVFRWDGVNWLGYLGYSKSL